MKHRFLLAYAGLAALGVLSWTTLSDQRIRLTTLAILAMFALRIWVRRKDVMPAEKDGDDSSKPMSRRFGGVSEAGARSRDPERSEGSDSE